MWSLVAALVLPVVPGIADEEGPVTLRPIGGLTFVDEIELTIANLVVYVTDKQGRAVTDLTKDDFEVYQDGDSKQITNFKLYTDEIIRSEYQEQSRIQPAETSGARRFRPGGTDAGPPGTVHRQREPRASRPESRSFAGPGFRPLEPAPAGQNDGRGISAVLRGVAGIHLGSLAGIGGNAFGAHLHRRSDGANQSQPGHHGPDQEDRDRRPVQLQWLAETGGRV
jgi:hypothetical protein